jgi:hypothetical protein
LALGAAVFQGSQYGEVQYIMTEYGNQVGNVTEGSFETVYTPWLEQWNARADGMISQEQNITDVISKMSAYLR